MQERESVPEIKIFAREFLTSSENLDSIPDLQTVQVKVVLKVGRARVRTRGRSTLLSG